MHVTNQLAQSVLPLNIGLSLYALISVAHHSNEEIDEYDYRHQHVNCENEFEQICFPVLGKVPWSAKAVVRRLTKYRKEQQFHAFERAHLNCKIKSINTKICARPQWGHSTCKKVPTKMLPKTLFLKISKIVFAFDAYSWLWWVLCNTALIPFIQNPCHLFVEKNYLRSS